MIDLNELLQPPNSDDGTSNADIWRSTSRVLRRRRWWRRGRFALVMIACFAAGAIVMQRPREEPVLFVVNDSVEMDERNETQTVIQDSPNRLERRASSQLGEKQRTLYRQAGDGYLKYGDEVAAVRCYRKALEGGSPPELAVRVDDTWLMMSLKVARNKE